MLVKQFLKQRKNCRYLEIFYNKYQIIMFQWLKNCNCFGDQVVEGFNEGQDNPRRKRHDEKPELSKKTTQVSNGPLSIVNPEQKTFDQDFPPTDKSLNYKKGSHQITWRPLSELLPTSTIGIVQSVNNLQQGNLRDSYFLAAISAIAKDWIRIQRLFGFDLNSKRFYSFTVYREGIPQTVMIDEFVPVLENEEPVFYKPKIHQIWVALLEKLWAKVCGSYGGMFHKTAHDVFVTFLPAPSIRHSLLAHPWQQLYQAYKLNVPICLNSRPSTPNPSIKPAQSYPLIAISNQTARVKNLSYLTAHYSGKYQSIGILPAEQKQIAFTFSEMMSNFESIDICYQRNGFTHCVGKTKSYSSKEKYFQLDVKEQGEVYLTARKTNPHKKGHKYLRMVLFRKDNFKYVDGKFSRTDSLLTAYYPKLLPAKYMVLIEGSSSNLFQQQTISLSAYSKCPCDIRESPSVQQKLLHRIFQHHARSNCHKQNDEDWTTSKFFEQESGYAYIAINLSTPVKYKVNVLCEMRKIQECGFTLLEEQEGEKVQVNLNNQNNFAIFIFSVNLNHFQENLHFPPKGVKITKFF